ncbi:unnamed protein product, partial [Brachionus calyciflorus]
SVRKGHNNAFIYVQSYLGDDLLEVQRAYGSNRIEIFGFQPQLTDKIVVVIRNLNGSLVQSLVISIRACLSEVYPSIKPTLPPQVVEKCNKCDNLIKITETMTHLTSSPSTTTQLMTTTLPKCQIEYDFTEPNNFMEITTELINREIINIFSPSRCNFGKYKIKFLVKFKQDIVNRLIQISIIKGNNLAFVSVYPSYKGVSLPRVNGYGKSLILISEFSNSRVDALI